MIALFYFLPVLQAPESLDITAFLIRTNHMNKRIFSVLLAIMLLLAISANANAAVKSVRSSLSLSFSGSTANCSAVVRESGKQINVTMELWHGSTLLASWTGSGTNYAIASGSYSSVQSGETYTLNAYGTASGTPFTVTPISRTCP